MEEERETTQEEQTVEKESLEEQDVSTAGETTPDLPSEEDEAAAAAEATVEAEDEVTSDLDVEELQAQIEDLKEQLAALEEEAAKNLDGWQRAQASFQNYRRRTETEKEEWRVIANVALLSRLLPILDDFDRAFDNVPASLEGHRWLDGVRLVKQKLHHLLKTENVEPIEVKPGDEFDPQYHEAVLSQPVENFEEGQIVAEAQRGYMQGERVLRPARVVVAAPMPQAEEPDEAAEEPSEESETED